MASAPLRPTPPTLAKYPIPVELITRLYRADHEDFVRLTATMPEYARARVAAYCSERERLQNLGQRMAGTCAEATLIKAAGAKAGAALFAESRPVAAANPVIVDAPEPTEPELASPGDPAIQIIEFPLSVSAETVPAQSKAA